MSNLTLRNVTKSFGKTEVIRGINLEVSEGEFVVFVGPSGCGKSTLLRMIAGLEDISSGDLFIGERRVNEVQAARRGIAMVFQSYALYPHLSVRQNMGFGLKVRKEKADVIASKIDEAAKTLQLGKLLDRYPRELSGGQRQRVAIGRAIVGDPDIFLFDEPLSNLDAELRVHMRAEIAGLHRRLSNTMVYVTHDQIEAMTLADRIVVLHDGNIEQVGSPKELYSHPRNIFVAQFIGSPKMNLCDATALSLPLEKAGIIVGGANKVGLRPEHLKVVDEGGILMGNVRLSEYTGGGSLLHVDIEGAGTFLVLSEGQEGPQPGEDIKLDFAPTDIHLFDENGFSLKDIPPTSKEGLNNCQYSSTLT